MGADVVFEPAPHLIRRFSKSTCHRHTVHRHCCSRRSNKEDQFIVLLHLDVLRRFPVDPLSLEPASEAA